MPTKTQIPALTALRENQGARLRRIRAALGRQVKESADAGGISRFAWMRMERGDAPIDGSAIGRFFAEWGYPAEYVISGSFIGLPDALIRDLHDLELADAEKAGAASGRIEAEPTKPLSGSSRQKSTARTGK